MSETLISGLAYLGTFAIMYIIGYFLYLLIRDLFPYIIVGLCVWGAYGISPEFGEDVLNVVLTIVMVVFIYYMIPGGSSNQKE